MTTTTVPNLPTRPGQTPLLGKSGRVWTVVLGLAFILLFQHFIRRMGMTGLQSGDWSHILVVPFISIYYIYINRDRILAQPRRVCLWGLPLLVVFSTIFIMGSTYQALRNDMLQGYSMIIALFGLLLLLFGPKVMKTLLFPVIFLGFGVKVSQAFWSYVASVLLYIAARGSVVLLNMLSPLTDMHASVRGSTIDLDYVYQGVATQTPLNVAEACSGMRMLMAFLALGAALAFLFPRRWWQRVALILLTVPIAIFVNILRISILALLYLIDPSYAQGQFHIFIGMLMLIPAAGMLMFVGWCLEKVVVGEYQPPAPKPLPHHHDPDTFAADWPTLRRGAILGGLMMFGMGLGYLLVLNHRTEGLITESFTASWPQAGNFVGAVVAAGAVLGAAAWLVKSLAGADNNRRWFIALGLWFMIWTAYKPVYDGVESSKGIGSWQECFQAATNVIPALFLQFLEVVIFVAISIAISTRMGILANFLICFSIYVLGHLTPLIVQSAEAAQAFETVGFFGQLIAIVFPVLNHFDVQAAINTERPVPLDYVAWSVIYTALYGAMAMLLALVMFEDRDLA